MFQAEIPGRNIRVYVVGGSVVASYEVVSDELDYRGAEKAVLRVALGAEEGDVWMARFPTLAHFLHDTSDPRQAASAGMGARVP